MQNRLQNEVEKRKEEMYQFYYRGIGVSIKKRRLELKMTQEALAKGICSNTYISKLENNAIVVNRENLYLIMEKMDLPQDTIGFPEDMVSILEKSFDYFVRDEKEKYRRLYEKISEYKFGILVVLARFGYLVMTERLEEAKPLYIEIFKYLNSLEEYGLAIFSIYAAMYNVLLFNFEQAKAIIDSVEKISCVNQQAGAMIAFVKYIIYGHLYLFSPARDSYEAAMSYFIKTHNLSRIADLMVFRNIFLIYGGSFDKVAFDEKDLMFLSGWIINYYLTVLSICDDKPERFREFTDRNTRFYSDYLYILAASYRERKLDDEYKKTIAELENATAFYKTEKTIDYIRCLELEKDKNSLAYKDYLVNFVLPYLMNLQNICYTGVVTDRVIEILHNHKRYKDALGYRNKYRSYVQKLQGIKNNQG
ncbi:MAG TPA: helix-turn-helix transcriptional regulator [Bacillota bacterium]|nr:helix-turn-helix transcriptional regulator [Bacillota bacterium]HPF42723.1 helix-turn-helix transcriptional regulator [Bacillota bacterium]HPJ85552.1 helix-turn-helix transcriptional regulator [Bacillota bacterium]HPQ62058.1 helix-turn-helix transcriptional regulator [Bacillota bacterium]HRX92033.1 helix-turn-helix transcriptional regulator [Candidatus Izemoplasmatales bacterium]